MARKASKNTCQICLSSCHALTGTPGTRRLSPGMQSMRLRSRGCAIGDSSLCALVNITACPVLSPSPCAFSCVDQPALPKNTCFVAQRRSELDCSNVCNHHLDKRSAACLASLYNPPIDVDNRGLLQACCTSAKTTTHALVQLLSDIFSAHSLSVLLSLTLEFQASTEHAVTAACPNQNEVLCIMSAVWPQARRLHRCDDAVS